jgi:hypothetical protein
MAEAAVVAPPNPEVIQPHHDVKLFNRWTFEDITVGFFFLSLSGSALIDLCYGILFG